MRTRLNSAILLSYSFAALILPYVAWPALAAGPDVGRLRVLIETDAGGDPDDEQSLVRFLLYANEWDVEGIIATRPEARPRENRNPERTGLGIVRSLVRAYGRCYPNLVKHDPRYPRPEVLLRKTVAGYENRDDGVNLILAAVDADDPRPVWFCNWGTDHGSASSSLRRVLDRVLKERGEKAYAAFKRKLRLSSADKFGEHTSTREPPFPLWIDTFRPELDGKRWYHRFSALTAKAGGFDLRRDVLTGHGPLGALYPTNTTHPQKEGDTMSFLYLVPTGMNDPAQPTWGSWAGRYGPNPEHAKKPYHWANQADTWRGETHRDNTLKRWAADLQNDFRARLDWCVKPVREANHPPAVVLNGKGGKDILHLAAAPGADVELNAAGSSDPDGNELSYEWFVYPEAGTYKGEVSLAGGNTPRVRIRIPSDAPSKTVHVVLAVRDSGTPSLTRYRRAVVTCQATMAKEKLASAEKSFEWSTATPASQGMSKEKLHALRDSLGERKTKAFLVIRNDRIVYEWYADGHGPAKPHYTASMAKGLVGGLSLGVALTDNLVALDDRVARYVPQWKDDPRKSKITLRHLGSHTSGLEDAEADGAPHDKLTGWKGDFWKRLDPPRDPFTLARDATPVLADPGERLRYSNPGIAMLTYAATAALRDAPRKDVRTLLRDRIMRPIGVADGEWSAGYGKTFTVDGLPLVGAWGGGSYTARATARVGRLILREGDWEGKRLLSREAVRQVTLSAGLPGDCGMGWWTNAGRRYDKLPADAVWAAGAGDQVVLVVPSLNLIVVRNGERLAPPPKSKAGARTDVFAEFHDALTKLLFEPVIAAVNVKAPRPESPVIRELTWAPKETLVRRAKGSDNWPLTWADDDHLYTAYGDGWGFEPKVPNKLSLGFARVEGEPGKFTGVNIRSPSGEAKGDDKAGRKASGLLAVDGVLYLWARNAGNSQLAWSNDRGRTWTWSDWKFTTSFGCPTFLNYGKNYAGAPDEYVYVYSHDSDSAYLPADRMVLARVPKDRIKDRAAYQFFTGRDAGGQPGWTSDVARRGAVFAHPGRCYRSGVSYNAGLKRYLWCQTLPGGDARVKGGFGVYDAPAPWGPWTTAYYADSWDVGPGETSSFPTKWMSADGRTLHLVFSGDDCFSVRRATVTPR